MLDALDEPLLLPKLDLALWVLLTGVSAAAIIGTVKASNALAVSYKSNVSKIENAQKAIEKVAKPDKSGNRPNDGLIKQAKTARSNLNKQLVQLWKGLYDRQAKAMAWPQGCGIEVNAEKANDEIAAHLRKTYNDEIVRREFERIFTKLNPRRPKAADAAESGGPFSSRPTDFEGLVAWSPQQREAIVARHVASKGPPSTARVRLVQEDLWLYESLVDALRPLNEGARDSLSAPLKQIDVLDVVQGAVLAAQQRPATIWTPTAAEPAASSEKPPKPLELPTGDSSDEVFLTGRYLDENCQPLAAGAKQPYAEFNQVFVYLKVVVDQRRMHELLARLANAALPVEIHEVVMETNPDTTVRPVAEDGTPAANSSPPKPQGKDVLVVAETTPWDTTVQIGGIVYLYNPPNAKKLGRGAAGSPGERGFRVPLASVAAKK